MTTLSGTPIFDHLRRFTRDGIVSQEQKMALKRAGLISWGSGIWALTDFGKSEAERLGYL
jgi:hypothetical protein